MAPPENNSRSSYVVYCDESRYDQNPLNRYFTIGGLWVPTESKAALTREMRELKASLGLNGEVKWSKTSQLSLAGYKRLVDFYTENALLCFRAIIVDQNEVDHDAFNRGDAEKGFYKFYYVMLEKWLHPQKEYLVLLDFKQNAAPRRHVELRDCLQNKARNLQFKVKDVTVIDSAESPLAQLGDLLTGAVAASWCGLRAGTPKESLAAHIAAGVGLSSLTQKTNHSGFQKINLFKIRLTGAPTSCA